MSACCCASHEPAGSTWQRASRRPRRSAAPARASRFASSSTPSYSPRIVSVALRTIRLLGDPVLRTPAMPVTTFDKELRTLVKDLTDTMLDAPGVGLAAPQL